MNIAPTYLFIGDSKVANLKAKNFIKLFFCISNLKKESFQLDNIKGFYCNNCIKCNLIDKEIHYNTIFIYPKSKFYNLADLTLINHYINFQNSEKLFFIISNAELFSTIVSNTLLKKLEEPPLNVHFILLASNKDLIIPTILSRSIIYKIDEYTSDDKTENIVNSIIDLDIIQFKNILNSLENYELDIIKILDSLYKIYLDKLKKVFNSKYIKITDLIAKSYNDIPIANYYKIFLKALFLKIIKMEKEL